MSVINGKQYCIEIKCPFEFCNQTLEQCLAENLNYTLKFNTDTNEYELNTEHKYYNQIQGKIFMTQSIGYILVVWTTKSLIAAQIEINENWKFNIDLLLDFYQFIPWLLK